MSNGKEKKAIEKMIRIQEGLATDKEKEIAKTHGKIDELNSLVEIKQKKLDQYTEEVTMLQTKLADLNAEDNPTTSPQDKDKEKETANA